MAFITHMFPSVHNLETYVWRESIQNSSKQKKDHDKLTLARSLPYKVHKIEISKNTQKEDWVSQPPPSHPFIFFYGGLYRNKEKKKPTHDSSSPSTPTAASPL